MIKKIILILTFGLLFLFVLTGVIVGVVVFKLKTPVQQLNASLTQLRLDLTKQDYVASGNQLKIVKSDVQKITADYKDLAWARYVPGLGKYYSDGTHFLVAAEHMINASEILVQALVDNGQTDPVLVLKQLQPLWSEIGQQMTTARQEIDQININYYPQKIGKYAIKDQLTTAVTFVDRVAELTNDGRQVLETLPQVVGLDGSRKYLVILQNDAELRPTGGFMTAYAIITVDKGKVSTDFSDNIYNLDAKFKERVIAPDPIKKYLPNVPYWYLRDRNLSPDLVVSINSFYPDYLKTKSPAVDGIITIDTQVMVNLLKVIGPITVDGFGKFSAETDKRCNCPQAFYELELQADANSFTVLTTDNRKAFVGPLMNSLIGNILKLSGQKLPELFNTLMSSARSKHLQFYFMNKSEQTAFEDFGLAGRVREYPNDYLLVVDTNFAGAKTNAWVQYSVYQNIQITPEGVIKTLTLTYKNPQKYFEDPKTKLRLNGIFRDWLRIYVPLGSTFIEAKGFETNPGISQDLGKTVFDGFFTLTPLNTRIITVKYKLPQAIGDPRKILIQKQAGSQDFEYTTSINGHKYPTLGLSQDIELNLK